MRGRQPPSSPVRDVEVPRLLCDPGLGGTASGSASSWLRYVALTMDAATPPAGRRRVRFSLSAPDDTFRDAPHHKVGQPRTPVCAAHDQGHVLLDGRSQTAFEGLAHEHTQLYGMLHPLRGEQRLERRVDLLSQIDDRRRINPTEPCRTSWMCVANQLPAEHPRLEEPS